MGTIEALQQIYIRLEADLSPTGFEGYQTLFYTQPGLSKDEAGTMEANLLYFPNDAAPPSKQVVFKAPSGDLAVANIVRLAEPDRHGRARYMAHNLVLPLKALIKAGGNPFSVLDHFPFVTTVDRATSFGDPKTANCPAATVELPDEAEKDAVELARTWPLQELRKLTFLALRTDKLAQQNMSLAIAGSPGEVREVLKVAYLVLPTPLCAACSFDTYFVDASGRLCNLRSTYYWAVGVPQMQSAANCIAIDAARKTVNQDLTWKPASVYERWLEEQIAGGHWDLIARYKNHAFALSQLLEGSTPEPAFLAQIPEDMIDAVFRKNPDVVTGRVRDALRGQVGAALAERLVSAVCRRFDSRGLFREIQRGFEMRDILAILYQEYLQNQFRPPRQEELAEIGKILQQQDHGLLRLLHATWTERQAEQQSAIQRLSDDDYREFIQAVFRSGFDTPAAFLDTLKAGLFVEAYLASAGTQRLLLSDLVEALAEARAPNAVARLAPLVPRQSEEALQALRKVIKAHTDIPAPFRAEVELAWDHIVEQAGLIKGLWLRFK